MGLGLIALEILKRLVAMDTLSGLDCYLHNDCFVKVL